MGVPCALGDKLLDADKEIISNWPFICIFEIEEGDALAAFCDGVSNHVADAEVAEMVSEESILRSSGSVESFMGSRRLENWSVS